MTDAFFQLRTVRGEIPAQVKDFPHSRNGDCPLG
jgi:hypothetical protein